MNHLSFSAQQNLALPELVQEAVIRLGFPKDRFNSLSPHDTIVIRLHELPDMMLSVQEDRLWIWSLLPVVSENRLTDMAAELLSILLIPVVGVETGQLVMGMSENGCELKALVNLDYLKWEEGLLPVFESYIERLTSICRALNFQ